MSIPAVNFNNRNIRTRRTGNSHGESTTQSPQQNRNRRTRFNSPPRNESRPTRSTRGTPFTLVKEMDSSDTDSSGEVQTITTRTKTPDFIEVPSSESSTESDNAEPVGGDVNWGASPPRDNKVNKEVEEPKKEEAPSPPHNGRKRVKRVRKVSQQAEEPEEEPEVKPPPPKAKPKLELPEESESEDSEGAQEIQVRRKPRQPTQNENKSTVPATTLSSSTGYVPPPMPEGISDFIIIRTKKFGGPKFNMIQNDRNVLVSEMSGDKIGKYHMICLKPTFEKTLPNYQGFLRVHENSTRFTLISNVEKPNDDRDGEIMGIYLDGKTKQRTVHIVVPKNGQPFFPISKRLNLSRQAKEKTEDFLDYFESTQSETDDFESDVVTKSVKNFKLTDKDGNLMFQIYKVADSQFNVKVGKPFNSLLAFGLSMSIILSK